MGWELCNEIERYLGEVRLIPIMKYLRFMLQIAWRNRIRSIW